MTSSSTVRSWWSSYECAPSKMVKVPFPGDGRVWNLSVADKSEPVWRAVAQIMESEPYLFLEDIGGTYNCRPPSLHSYGLAIDLNPSKNPFQYPVVTDMPPSFIERMEGITANGKKAVDWGGRWSPSNPPDPMHYQIAVSPSDCSGQVVWDSGGGNMATWKKLGDDIVDVSDARAVNEYQGWSFWTKKDFDYDENDPKQLDERNKVISARLIQELMIQGDRLKKAGF